MKRRVISVAGQSGGGLSRATFLRGTAATASLLALGHGVQAQTQHPSVSSSPGTMHTRTIPSTGETLPMIGCGTWQTFHVGTAPAERAPLADVLQVLFAAGGSVIDSSPMYGPAEGVVGDLIAAMQAREAAFIATKVWTRGRKDGIAQMEESFRRLRTDRIDLMQVHNLLDWRVHLETLRGWKKDGRIRYLGVTHYTESAYADLEAVMRSETLDFVQFNYSIADRAAERRLLPLAQERGIAVLINQPFGGGGLLRRLLGKPLPDWAGEIGCVSWPQILLKFILGHPAVTCVIPGTGRPEHMRDNVAAGIGVLPDAAMRDRMVKSLAL
jgi:diketogulonate reductase-like aldo/keto reductase